MASQMPPIACSLLVYLHHCVVIAAGVTLPLLSQSIILFQIALSYLVLKKNLEREQVSLDKHPSPCAWQTYLH